MQRRIFYIVLLGIVVATLQPTRQIGHLQRSVMQASLKPKVQVQAISLSGGKLFTGISIDVNRSMKARRDMAWETVTRVWTPVRVSGGTVPAWMTWYEPEDIEQLFREYRTQAPATHVQSIAVIDQLMVRHAIKDLQTSLISARFGKVLRQFTFPEFRSLNSHARPGTGTIYYSPAYVKHLLENAENIANYDAAAFSKTAAAPKPPTTKAPSGNLTDITKARDTGRIIDILKTDINNIYAQAMDHEMPPDAVMVKVNWVPADDGAIRYELAGPDIVQGFAASPTGKFPLGGVALQGRRYVVSDNNFLVATDEHGKRWALMGMHIASKNLRTWMWTTLFWGGFGPGHGAWEADQPDTLKKQWPLIQSYGMATASDYREGDPTPWKAYEGHGDDLQHLADTIKAIAHAMNGVQWCANPYIEVDISHTNCIGCHQGSPRDYLPRTLVKARQSNVGDFSFSIATNRDTFIKVLAERDRILKRMIKSNPVVKPPILKRIPPPK